MEAFIGNINPFRYRSYYYDFETNLYYLETRYYDPETGRFINADEYINGNGDMMGYNMYAYCSNNPVMEKDPSGQGFLKNIWNSVKKFVKKVWNKITNFCEENVGAEVSAGKEVTNESIYIIGATLENGAGYNKSFGNQKPITFFASTGENWWEWSVGVDVNINGYGGGISIGTECSINIHLGNDSHEYGLNALGRAYHKHSYKVEDAYAYYKTSFNLPEIALMAVIAYYAPNMLPVLGTAAMNLV